MSTEDNNKMIDEFLLSKGEYISYKDSWGSEVWGEYKPSKYHSDFNLLMSAVVRIDKTDTLSSIEEPYWYCVSLNGNYAYVKDGKTGDTIIEIKEEGEYS